MVKELEGKELDSVLNYLEKLTEKYPASQVIGLLSSHTVALVYTQGIPLEVYVNGIIHAYRSVEEAAIEPDRSNIVLLNPLSPVKA